MNISFKLHFGSHENNSKNLERKLAEIIVLSSSKIKYWLEKLEFKS